MDNNNVEILSTVVVHHSGSLKRIRHYIRGPLPNGIITHGYTGLETMQEKDVIIPSSIFNVVDKKE